MCDLDLQLEWAAVFSGLILMYDKNTHDRFYNIARRECESWDVCKWSFICDVAMRMATECETRSEERPRLALAWKLMHRVKDDHMCDVWEPVFKAVYDALRG